VSIKTLYSDPEYLKRIGQKVVDGFGVKKKKVTRVQSLQAAPYNRELYRIRASRLVDPFPDELVIQEKTISLIKKDPFVKAVETIPVKDVGRVVYANNVVFGSLEILGKNTAHDLKIRGLNKREAAKAKQIVEGLLLEDQGDINMPSWIQAEEHRELLVQTGLDPDEEEPMAEVKKTKLN
jgi:hypothetical protein